MISVHEWMQPTQERTQTGLATRFAKGCRLLTLNRLFNRFVVTGTGTDSKNEQVSNPFGNPFSDLFSLANRLFEQVTGC